jgi:hypothetical protein
LVATISTPKQIWPSVELAGIQPCAIAQLKISRISMVPEVKTTVGTSAMYPLSAV